MAARSSSALLLLPRSRSRRPMAERPRGRLLTDVGSEAMSRKRRATPIALLLAGVASVLIAILAASTTWKAVWIGVASTCATAGLVDASALLELMRREKAILRVVGPRIGFVHQRFLWVLANVFDLPPTEPIGVAPALRALVAPRVDLTVAADVRARRPKHDPAREVRPARGWQFLRRIHPAVSGGRAAVTFAPPSIGRYRATATFGGSKLASPSDAGQAKLRMTSRRRRGCSALATPWRRAARRRRRCRGRG